MSRIARLETYLKCERIVVALTAIRTIFGFLRFEACDWNRCEPVAIRIAANREPRFKTSKNQEHKTTKAENKHVTRDKVKGDSEKNGHEDK